ncbi:hypothetical protein ACFLSE_02905 [Bacteroidota bacterium]
MVKKSLLFCFVLALSISMFAQVPDAFKYQAVIRNSSGEIIPNQNISLRISILDGSASGTNVFTETHSETTSDLGLVAINIGKGSLVSGDFGTINWSTGDKYLKVEIDENGGTSFTDFGAVELLSVPYAFYANNVANKDDADADPVNEIQDLDLTSNILTITNNPSATQVNLAPYSGTNTDEQVLDLTGTDLSISGGNTVDLSPLQDGVDDADNDASNEIQDLDLTSNVLSITNNPSATQIDLAPYQGTNTDEQTLSLAGTDLSISGGNTVDLITVQDGVDDADNSPTNELQTLTIDGDTLEISGSNKVIFTYDSSYWAINGEKIYYNTGNVGVGSSNPVSKLEVRSSATSGALFQVINADNDTVFAVYPDGVKVFVNPDAKGKVGGFAISGKSPSKAGGIDYMRVTGDSTRIYVNETSSKGTVGGFAISGRSPSKGTVHDYLVVTNDSTRIYVNDTATLKGKVGGFAISGRSPSKGTLNDYLKVTRDSTRVYITEDAGKGKVGGFAISGRSPSKGVTKKFMDMTKENYFIGHESGEKTEPGSGVAGLYNTFFGYQAGKENVVGHSNVFIGNKSGFTNSGDVANDTLGSKNVFIGFESGYSNTLGADNVLIGYQSGYGNTTAGNNVCIGSGAGYANTQNSDNVFIGLNAGFYHGSWGAEQGSYKNNIYIGLEAGMGTDSSAIGRNNIFIGPFSGKNNTTGQLNVFMGYKSGELIESGAQNVIIGNEAGYSINSGQSNTIIGTFAGQNNDGSNNTFIGDYAGSGLTSSTRNTFVGSQAGQLASSGDYNVFMGYNAGRAHNSGDNNVYIGYEAGVGHFSNPEDGENNVFIGTESGSVNTTGVKNVFMGYQSGYSNSNGHWNVFIGNESGHSNTDGQRNVFIGHTAGRSNTSGNVNLFMGEGCGYMNTTGGGNVFLGTSAGYNNDNGSWNVFMGVSAGNKNISGSSNIFIGKTAGEQNTDGLENVFLGNNAGINAEGSFNVVIGSSAGQGVYGVDNSGAYNVIIGRQAGYYNTTGSNNIYIGQAAGPPVEDSTGSNNIFIGSYAGNYATGSDKLFIGDGEFPLIYGNFQDDSLIINGDFHVNGNITAAGTIVPDYVFEDNYELETIEAHAEFMWREKHLPAVNSAKQIEETGIVNLNERREQLLEELEKAHIYIEYLNNEIKAIKENKDLKNENEKLREENAEIKNRLTEIEKLLKIE